MAATEPITIKAEIKVTPDMSQFAARLVQEISCDDPLAHAILDATETDPRSIAAYVTVGQQMFALHHWTLISAKDGEPRRLRTSWFACPELENPRVEY